MIYVVDSNKSIGKVINSSFAGLSIWERKHIQEWIKSAPDILGEELLILSDEFDRFDKSADRLDLLAMDRNGNIVVVELKRDSLGAYADLQAIRYAAMISTITIDKMVPYYKAYIKKTTGQEIDNPRQIIEEFVSNDEFEEFSDKPRIILCSEGFGTELTTTVLWLNNMGLDISCITITPYSVAPNIIIVPKKVIPLPGARDYFVQIREKVEAESNVHRNRPKTMKYLLENGVIAAGTRIYLKHALPTYVKYEDNDFYKAEITGKLGQSNAVKWIYDDNEYAISNLTWKIFKEKNTDNKDPGGVNGNYHWELENGKSLWEIAEERLRSL